MTLAPRTGAKDKTRKLLRARGKRPGADRGLVISLILLISFGLLTLYAASYYNAQDRGSAYDEVLSQLAGMGLGLVGLVFFSRLDYRRLRSGPIVGGAVALSVLLLLLVAIPGVGAKLNGSRRWLRLGPVSFQPSELAKYASILFMARALSDPGRDVKRLFRGVAPLMLVPGLMFFLILLQPNLSTAGSILIVSVILVALSGARWLHLGGMGLAGLALGAFYAFSEPYRRERMLSFRNPFAYVSDEGYQLSQSLMAFGSGGLFGMGLGQGRQKYAFLPYPESDFIFAVVGEDMGFIGCAMVMALFAAFVFFGLRAALRCPDRFGSLLAAGITCMIGAQSLLNVAVVTGMMPTTGLSLPFFSAGGTSAAVMMCAYGVLLSVSRSPGTALPPSA